MGDLTDDERRVLDAIAGRTPDPAAVVAQVCAAKVSGREWTGVGCYVDLTVPDEVPPLPAGFDSNYGATGRMGGHFCFFILFLTADRSRIELLEIVTTDVDLPPGAKLESIAEAD